MKREGEGEGMCVEGDSAVCIQEVTLERGQLTETKSIVPKAHIHSIPFPLLGVGASGPGNPHQMPRDI